MNTGENYCGFCGKLLDSYDESVKGCDRCGTRFDEIEPVEKAAASEQSKHYEEGLFK